MVFTRYVAGQWNDIFSMALGPDQEPVGVPVRLSDLKLQIGRPVWIAGGRELVFSAGGWGDERFLYRMSSKMGAKAESLGNVRIAGLQPAYSQATRALAFARGGIQWSIWGIDTGAAFRGVPALERVIASSSSDQQPDLSSDGESIVFASNRQRSRDLWVAPVQGADARQLVSFKESGATAPRWSPDRAWVAFESRRGGQSDVYLYRMSDGSIRNLTNNPAEDFLPSWSADGQFVYFSSDRTGTRQIWKVPRDGGAPAMVTHNGGVFAIESPDGKHLYYTTSMPPATLRRRSMEDGTERDIAAGVITVPGFGVTAQGVFYLPTSASEAESVHFYDLASGSSRELIRLPQPAGNGFSVSRDGKRILLVLREHEGSDLLLMRNVN
jgi:dipeptidyl aminopeptidase/acylaminoacyl peptidase